MSAGRRVLIVDDQPSNVRVLAEALGSGYELFFARDGERALERALRGDLDLVLLDVQMPGLDGFEVCRRIKADERGRDLPVIFVTALGEVADETRGFEAGGVDYIAKPISPPVVRARVRTHIELKEARDRLQALATSDGLTGVANRRSFDDRLEREWRRAQRGRLWLALALADVDHFKAYNDRYGHAGGDDALRAVAAALAAACRRPGDVLARYGGEEFGLVLPGADPEGAAVVASTALLQVQELAVEHGASPLGRLSVSLGIVSLVPDESQSAAVVLDLADRALYEAKAGGRAHAVLLEPATQGRLRIEGGSR